MAKSDVICRSALDAAKSSQATYEGLWVDIKERDVLIAGLRIKLRQKTALSRKLRSQLRKVFAVRNRGWYRGYVWGFEIFWARMQDDEQRADYQNLKMKDYLVDPVAIEELVEIGKEELLDALNLDSGDLVGGPSASEPEDSEEDV